MNAETQAAPRTASFYTLGCKLNFSETATLARQFEGRDFEVVDFRDGADVCVVNTCSVTEQADKKCRKIVRQALKFNPEAYVVVVGCYAQLKPKEIAGIPGVSAVLGAAEKFRLFDLLDDFTPGAQTKVHRCAVEEARDFVPTFSENERTRAFLKIQDGCDYKCAFCTIPLARGASRSDSPENILANARRLAGQGVREIVLSGINLGDYGAGGPHKFIDVARALDAAPGPPRYRVSSIEPNLLADEIIEFVAGSRRFMPHFHVPLQSGSDAVLRLMRRRYLRGLYADRVEAIKRAMPDACIGCDVIVGFPGETDARFEETYAFLNELEVSYLHVFTFSERADTAAAVMPGAVPHDVRAERSQRLRMLSDKKKHAFYAAQAGTEAELLLETEVRDGFRLGFTRNYVRAGVPEAQGGPDELLRVRLGAPDGAPFVAAEIAAGQRA